MAKVAATTETVRNEAPSVDISLDAKDDAFPHIARVGFEPSAPPLWSRAILATIILPAARRGRCRPESDVGSVSRTRRISRET